MKITIFSSLPEFFDITNLSIMGRSLKENLWSFNVVNIKQYGLGGYKRIDDTPYGGGSGMILRPDVVEKAIEDVFPAEKPRIILTSPRGKKFTQKMAFELAKEDNFAIFCNRFEGVDQRAIEYYNLEEVSIGDYVLFGGEVAAMAMLESVVRLLPGVISSHDNEDSFCGDFEGMLEYDHYTKPNIWNGLQVPDVLRNGNHAEIKKWKIKNAKKAALLNKDRQ